MKGFRARSELGIRPASELSTAALAALFTAGYEGYAYPVRLDEAGFASMAQMSDFDLARSRVAVVDGDAVGICVLGVRGDEGWIGGLGVVPSARRGGVGRKLMDEVLDAAEVRRVSLEVLEPNAGAIALYERLDFELTRMLEVWSLNADPRGSTAGPADVVEAHAWIRAHRRAPEPWQRADESVARLGDQVEAVAVPDLGAALFRVSGELASVLQLAAVDEESAAALLAAVRARGQSLRCGNVPEGDPAAPALRKLGGELEVRQLEMALIPHS